MADKDGLNPILAMLAVAGVLYWMHRRQQDLIATLQSQGGASPGLLPGPAPVPGEAKLAAPAIVEVTEDSVAIDAGPPVSVISYAPQLKQCTDLLPKHFYSERGKVYRKEIIRLNKAIHRLHNMGRRVRFNAAGAQRHQAKLRALQERRNHLVKCAAPLRVAPPKRVVSRGRIHRQYHPPPGVPRWKWEQIMEQSGNA